MFRPRYKVDRFLFSGDKSLKSRWHRFLRGYAWGDVWDMFTWFINTVEPMLRHLKDYGQGYPGVYEPEEWEAILDEMIYHLHYMQEENVINEKCNGNYLDVNIGKIMNEHKDKFFELFSREFYNLWD